MSSVKQKGRWAKDMLKGCDYFKDKQNIVWSIAFWYVKICIFWKCIQYNMHCDKKQMLKNFPSHKINGTKNASFFLSRAPTHQNFTFDFQFIYKLRHKVCLSNTVCGIFHIWFPFVFIKFLFLFNNMRGLFNLKTS